jgi:cell surface protein SprA
LVEEDDQAKREFAPVFKINSDAFENIFGSNEIEIRPQGSAELTFGMNMSKVDNPRIPERQRKVTTFNFDQKIQLNVTGNIGTRMKLNVNYNTESQFDFENQMKLGYTGDEDQIVKKIELGTVQMPLSGSLIQGSSSLFGAKIETQWGKLKNTIFLSRKGSAKKSPFKEERKPSNLILLPTTMKPIAIIFCPDFLETIMIRQWRPCQWLIVALTLPA